MGLFNLFKKKEKKVVCIRCKKEISKVDAEQIDELVFCKNCVDELVAKSDSVPEQDTSGVVDGTIEKQEFSCKYTYKATAFSEGWLSIECNEADSVFDHEPFIELVQSIARTWNNNEWQGTFSLAGEMRYRIKNDPINLVYQWDSLYGIIFEYPSALSPNSVMNFIAENYGITTAK